MSNPAALYYPHTNITDTNIIKNALLLWDYVEYITPTVKWNHKRFESKAFNDAIDIIAKPHYPSNTEKQEVHDRVTSLVKKGFPPWFLLDSGKHIRNFETYSIYPNKLNDATWQLLKDQSLARFETMDNDYHLTPYLGLMVMSFLADVCAGETKRKITDRAEAYSWLQKYATVEAGGEYITGLDVSQVAPAYERLVTLSIKVLNTDSIPISTLVSMRKREAKSSSSDYRNFRINYLKKLDEYVVKITQPKIREEDINEHERLFQLAMKDDLKEMRKELKDNKRSLVFSKEVAVAAGAVKGALLAPILGLTELSTLIGSIGIGALVKGGKEFTKARRKALAAHPMSWLYLADKKANKFDPRKIII